MARTTGSTAVLLALLGAALASGGALAAGGGTPLVDTDLEWFRTRPVEVSWGADPFLSKLRDELPAAAGARAGAPPPAFILSAVVLGGEKPGAVLDGALVHPGTELNGYRVERIEQDRIFLSGSAGRLEVPLLPLYRLHETLP